MSSGNSIERPAGVIERAGGARQSSSLVDELIRGVLANPFVRRVRRSATDLLWVFKGSGFRNPVITKPVRSILFVCKGNICRSPFAAVYAAQLLAKQGRTDIVCESAGLNTKQANRPPKDACEAAAQYQLSLDEHSPLQLTQELADAYSVIVVMESDQLSSVRATFPNAAGKCLLLPLAVGSGQGEYARYNIADPFGRPRAAFDECYERLAHDVRRLLEQFDLLAVPPPARPKTAHS